jgi:tRNA(fMet)-specific endonuclease VapC
MSGARLLLDTNAVVSLLRGTAALQETVSNASWVGISVITRLEFLAFSGLSDGDRELFDRFCDRIETVWLERDAAAVIDETIRIRRIHGLRLPDAIIAATALASGAALVTADGDFRKVEGLEVRQPER